MVAFQQLQQRTLVLCYSRKGRVLADEPSKDRGRALSPHGCTCSSVKGYGDSGDAGDGGAAQLEELDAMSSSICEQVYASGRLVPLMMGLYN
ncbi:hypothetical protein EJB05_13381 [Eragrostis curvula]|uniref:Uncharacterized protein n=1 Tax=Eragrostis curvula TaxID=38414 RepID=A0A5J9VWE6_9POAL|nr:hypothetical protein EJB05_13381 [Eragrostis curvula]